MKPTSVRIRATDFPSHRRRRRRDQNSSCCCLGVVALCLLVALVAARKPLAGALRSLFHRPRTVEPPRPEFPLGVQVPAQTWFRYDLIPVEITYVKADGSPVSDRAPQVRVLDAAGDPVATVGNLETVPLHWDAAQGLWRGNWPVPFGAQAGPEATYTVEARAEFDPAEWAWDSPEEQRKRAKEERRLRREYDERLKEKGSKAGEAKPPPKLGPRVGDEATCTALASFTVQRRPRVELPPGTCVVNWEPDFPDAAELTRPDGTKGDWRVMFDWAEFMGADAFWFRGAVTEAYSAAGALTLDNPWNQRNLDKIPEMGQEAHRRGLKFGAWAAAMETYPNRPSQHAAMRRFKPPYQWSQDFSRSRRIPTEEASISLLDEQRPQHLARFLAQMQATETVDYVGFDYIRSGADWGGYELAGGFAASMPVIGLPGEWVHYTRNDRMGWLCDRVDGEAFQKNPQLYHQWNWYRAQLLCRRIRAMLRDSKLQKPLWTFTLSWWHGEQHGQDPLMLADSGVAIDAVMLYECRTVAQFDSLVSQWRDGIDEEGGIPGGHINIMGGDQVSFGSHQRLTNPAAPEEMYRRLTKAASSLTKGQPLWGAFVHDVSRLCAPRLAANRGPYSGREWALAGAAAFSTVRANWGVQPVTCTFTVPKQAPVGSTVTCELRIESLSDKELRNVTIEVMDTAGINRITKQEQVPTLGAKQAVTVPIQVQVRGWDASRASRYMVACKIRWPDADYGQAFRKDLPRLYTVMSYLSAA